MNKSEARNPKTFQKTRNTRISRISVNQKIGIIRRKLISEYLNIRHSDHSDTLSVLSFPKYFDIRISSFRFQRGQALITLIFFVIISVTITSAAIIVIAVNALSITKLQEGSIAYYAAESGLENAILRAIREPSYTGEILTDIDNKNVTITVPPGPYPKTVTVVSQSSNFRRTIEAQMDYNSGYFTISGWKEI